MILNVQKLLCQIFLILKLVPGVQVYAIRKGGGLLCDRLPRVQRDTESSDWQGIDLYMYKRMSNVLGRYTLADRYAVAVVKNKTVILHLP